jgi:prefoldin subunit 4
MSNKKLGKGELDDDVNIRYEDQIQINKFAKNNTKLHEIQDDLVEKRKELQNIRDAIDALDELLLLDETQLVPFQYGEVFTYLSVTDANGELERKKGEIEEDIKKDEAAIVGIKKILGDLKVQLYAKFGSKINLEEAEE